MIGKRGWHASSCGSATRSSMPGYRPALERRHADLTVAREIVGEAG